MRYSETGKGLLSTVNSGPLCALDEESLGALPLLSEDQEKYRGTAPESPFYRPLTDVPADQSSSI